jgi:NADH-quinone oxidoreductase subunit M
MIVGSFFFWVFVFFGCFSSVLGGLMGVGQVQVRILMAYSSISHWGWILGLLGFSVIGSFSYFLFYFFISFLLFYFFGCQGSWRVGGVVGLSGLFLMVGLLSLGGLPPLRGFVPK